MNRRKLLIAHPELRPAGGSNVVAAWALQALREDFDLSLATLYPIDITAINRSFGTSLSTHEFQLLLAPSYYRLAIDKFPTRGALLRNCLAMRWTQRCLRRWSFVSVLGTENEMDFERAGLQYVHYPGFKRERPVEEMVGVRKVPGFLPLYNAICMALCNYSPASMKRNTTLVNSQFIAERVLETHGIPSLILPPPVPVPIVDTPWEQRSPSIVGLGRMDPIKRWHWAVETVDRLRERGHQVGLTLIGHADHAGVVGNLKALQATRPWFRLLHDLSREELIAEVARHRYGIHTMFEEHFGIGPAELQRLGCLVFAHNSGGPREIVGNHEALLFEHPAEAAERIAAVLSNARLESELRAHAMRQATQYTTAAFVASLRNIVQTSLSA
jgi:glycosyltransferase involved in cell wall biosynthesis